MKKIILTIILILSINISAQTIVTDTFVLNNTLTWTKAGSPYIIRGNLNLSSSTLNIVDAKVVVEYGHINSFESSVINISKSDISGVYNPSYIFGFFNSKVSINNTKVNINKFIESYTSDIYIDGVTSFNNSYDKLISLHDNSNFSLINSRIENYKGLVLNIDNINHINIQNTEFVNNEKVIIFHRSKSASINKNDFENNKIAIESYMFDYDNSKIDLENNFFQINKPNIYRYVSESGVGEKNILAGPFTIRQFSASKNVTKAKICCSNIIFLPGLMGSRLYMDGLTQNQLWEPNRNTDVKKLFLSSDGKSVNKVYTNDVIGKTNIFGGLPGVDQNIYKDFLNYLNSLKTNKTINDYKAMPYDWRMSPDYILDNGIDFKDAKIDLIKTIQDLQKTSKTGTVTIITHSNGGIVAKQLILELKKKGLDNLIDKIVFVAMPEYGTSQAITALLYGHGQSIAGGLILKSSIAKDLGKNMATAYTLLPTEKYYTYKNTDKALIENTINNYSGLNNLLLGKAKTLHASLDNMTYPDHMGIYQILGTGINTVSGLYVNGDKKVLPRYDKNGDGVVEDLFSSRYGTTTYIDLRDTKYSHGNIMNSKDIISNIDNIINPKQILGLDYNKIIKNNNYSLLQISENIGKSIPDIDIILGMNNIYTDKYYTYVSEDFSNVTESLDKNNRFDISDNQINYLYDKEVDNIIINPKTDNFLDLNILKNIDGNISNVEFKDIPVFKDVLMVLKSNDYFKTLSLNLPLTGKVIDFVNTVSRLPEGEIIDKIITDIKASSMEGYLKDRYIRRIELYRKNKDSKYLTLLKKKVSDSVGSINKIAYSTALKARYSKLKEDYVYLSILLLRL